MTEAVRPKDGEGQTAALLEQLGTGSTASGRLRSAGASLPRMQENMRHMQRHEVKAYPQPQPEASITRGFEAVAARKVVAQLADHRPIVGLKALRASMELLLAPLTCVQCLQAGICEPLVSLLQAACPDTREQAAKALAVIMQRELGVRKAIAAAAVPALLAALADASPPGRTAAISALYNGCSHQVLRQTVVAADAPGAKGAMHWLVQFARREVDALMAVGGPAQGPEHQERAVLGVQVIGKLAHMRGAEAAICELVFDASAIPFLRLILAGPDNPSLKLTATHALAALCSLEAAPELAVDAGCVPSLLQLVTRGHMDLAVEATGALAAIVVSAAGKEALLKTQEALLFVELLDWMDLRLERNVLAIISNAAVHPTLRKNLVEAGVLPELRKALLSKSMTIQQAAKDAFRQCSFQHRPVA